MQGKDRLEALLNIDSKVTDSKSVRQNTRIRLLFEEWIYCDDRTVDYQEH